MNKKLTEPQKRVLVYWYLTHKEKAYWPTAREAAAHFKVSHQSILYHVNKLKDRDLMVAVGRKLCLTPDCIAMLYETEMVATSAKARTPKTKKEIRKLRFGNIVVKRATQEEKEKNKTKTKAERRKHLVRLLSKKHEKGQR